ncbi:ATP phosphoribosyltransferase regulatory subunit [Helicobacter sp. 13S00477-4]|uniref:ATP phosphoribosyltransferase regulatory subunit n=1 Tax=Helicobacter sp. 13S00477-4 TaxID=1905759 RepID=UPI000BA53F51|nr:ATP phosphoribosyltransferase regulatory subunit [Helicobacter sp. 13S00477-4]PAF52701.1 ATP phosphoribosyltransferase regulatory subunit [Helicobacter sp. 13S00477-4]
MVFEHEIPQGTKLYFGTSAKMKRRLENIACEIFYQNDFEEILTPSFMYLEHQKNFSNRDIIRLSSKNNHQISLRYDTTIDAIRIITKRLLRSTCQKKWFYIQPVFSYPTNEIYQIGAECLDIDEIPKMLCLSVEIMKQFGMNPILQVSNVKILKLCSQETGKDLEFFRKMQIEDILKKAPYMSDLIKIQTRDDLANSILKAPEFLKNELKALLEGSSYCRYEKMIFSPLELPPVDYYNDLVFRMFEGNHTFLLGGKYTIEGVESCGFGIYTDDVIEYLMKIKGMKWLIS